jgi:hypothetical protein
VDQINGGLDRIVGVEGTRSTDIVGIGISDIAGGSTIGLRTKQKGKRKQNERSRRQKKEKNRRGSDLVETLELDITKEDAIQVFDKRVADLAVVS